MSGISDDTPVLAGGTDGTLIGNTRNSLNVSASFQDGIFVDNVGRLRVSDVAVIASHCFYSGPKELNFNTSLTGGATRTFNANFGANQLNVTTANGDSVVWQSKRYYEYSPGISHDYGIAAVIGTKKTNVRQRWGHFDASDGCFFEQTGTDIAVVNRTSTSGSIVDTRVVQANWNLDKLDGTGASGVTLDTSKHNKYGVEMSWYGAGRVRFGIVIGGFTVYCHEIGGGNLNIAPYNRTPKLPIRVELTNTGTAASATSLTVSCTSAIQEASAPFRFHYNFSKSDNRTGTVVNSVVIPLLSIRPTTTFNGIANRVSITPIMAQLLAGTQLTLCQLILNPTLTGASFSSVNAYSATEFDVSSTALSGGTVVAEFYIQSNSQNSFNLENFADTIILSQNIAATSGDILTVAAQSLAGNTTTYAALQWREAQ